METRTDRQEHISWWRQDVISAAKVAVIGAGALGNEVLKNLALLGIGEIHVFDMDTVEVSNLSRTVLFRIEDAQNSRSKALIAAERVRELHVNPNAIVTGHHLDVVWDLGGGFFRQMSLVLGCLDNLEARLAVGRQCYQFSKPFIDGGIRELDGRVQMHLNGSGACFDCTIGDGERERLEERYSCAKVMRSFVSAGLVPSVQVTSAFIASLMCQEAVKCLHGTQTAFGSVMTWLGRTTEFDVMRMQRNPHCLTCSMPPSQDLRELPLGPGNTGRDLVELLPRGWSVLLPSPFLRRLECHLNGHKIPLMKAMHRCRDEEIVCPLDGNDALLSLDKIDRLGAGTAPGLLSRSLWDLGIPAQAALYGQNGDDSALFVLTGTKSEDCTTDFRETKQDG